MEKELISVLMVNYNHEDTIGKTIESVLNQTYRNIQFIIVDDGSTDRSREVIQSYKDTRIEYYEQKENRHICHATNVGFEKVRGEYLARIDSDDIWYLDKLEKQILFLKGNPNYKICFTWIDLIDENGSNINEESKDLLGLFETGFRGQTDCLHTFYFIGNCLSHPSVFMRTEVMLETGKFDPGYMQSHDFDYWVRVAKKHPIYVMEERLLAMRRFLGVGKKNTNNSNHSQVSSARFSNEFADIRAHFFEEMDEQLFCQTFGDDFVCPDSKTEIELECEKAFLLCRPIASEKIIPAAGIHKMFMLLRNPETAKLLEEKFDFGVKAFYEMTGNTLFYSKRLEEEMKRQEQQRRKLEAEISYLKNETDSLKKIISEYEESKSWKVTAPLREIGKHLPRKS